MKDGLYARVHTLADEDPMKALILDANTLSWPHDDEPETRRAKWRVCSERTAGRLMPVAAYALHAVALRRWGKVRCGHARR
jgi:hypothetical protein